MTKNIYVSTKFTERGGVHVDQLMKSVEESDLPGELSVVSAEELENAVPPFILLLIAGQKINEHAKKEAKHKKPIKIVEIQPGQEISVSDFNLGHNL